MVKLHVKIFDFFLNFSIWVAISVCAMFKVTCIHLEIPNSSDLLAFVFFGTVFGYNFIKFFEQKQLTYLSQINIKFQVNRFKKQHVFDQIGFLANILILFCCLYFLVQLQVTTILVLCVSAIIVLFYAVSFKGKTLRSTSGIKIYVVGLVWAMVTVLLPVIEANTSISNDVWVTFLQRMLFVIVLILPFEIRDLKVDDVSLATVPQKLGVKKTKILGVLLLLLFLLLEFFKSDVLNNNFADMSFIVIITLVFLLKASVKQPKYYASFFVEGIPILWWLVLAML